MSPRLTPKYDDARWLLKALREAAHELSALGGWGLDEDELRWRPSDDDWSLKEIAAHLRDCEEHFLESLELIFFLEQPRIPAFDADALVLEQDHRETELYEALERFAHLRHRTVNLLWSAERDWDRIGVHPYLGPVSVLQLARRQSEHDLEHLWQARRLRSALGGLVGRAAFSL